MQPGHSWVLARRIQAEVVNSNSIASAQVMWCGFKNDPFDSSIKVIRPCPNIHMNQSHRRPAPANFDTLHLWLRSSGDLLRFQCKI